MSRLVVASNRVADLSKPTQSGGLAVAIGDALRDGNGVWFGWDGEIVPDGSPTGLQLDRQNSVSVATQSLSQTEYDTYYLGYSNKVLWPVFHYRLDLADFDPMALEGYRQVNMRFARSLAALIDKEDVVWVHDYHLIPLGGKLRKLGVTSRIGFFLHIPFPPPEIITAVPDHDWLVDTLSAYDVIGFQTETDLENYRRYVAQTEGPAGGHRRTRGPQQTVAMAVPIGIDHMAFRAMAETDAARDRIARLKRGIAQNHVIGVDRLDYSKGLPDRFRAFRRFLERFPEHRKDTVLMQIAPPTREELTAYAEIRSELEQLSGAINGKYGDFDWTPVRYLHRHVPRETLAALFRGSKIGLVTPLRDGMNLVAKEYVAAQDPSDPGVLILSQFAGAADDLSEAILVNPYDPDEVAEAMNAAVRMDLDRRKERHTALLKRVATNDVAAWRSRFLEALKGEAKLPASA